MKRLLITKNYRFELDTTELEFREIFSKTLDDKKSSIGKYLKGNIEGSFFKIKSRTQLFRFSFNKPLPLSDFFELDGSFDENKDGLIVSLKFRIKTFLQIFWIIGLVVMFFYSSPFSSPYGLLIFLFTTLFFYLILKILVYVEEPFYIDSFKNMYGLKVLSKEKRNLETEQKGNFILVKTKKVNRIFFNIGAVILAFGMLFLLYFNEDFTQFVFYIPLLTLLILSFHQCYQKYQLDQFANTNKYIDFWLFYKMAMFPIPSVTFVMKKEERVELENIRNKYNMLTGLMYLVLILFLIMVILVQ